MSINRKHTSSKIRSGAEGKTAERKAGSPFNNTTAGDFYSLCRTSLAYNKTTKAFNRSQIL